MTTLLPAVPLSTGIQEATLDATRSRVQSSSSTAAAPQPAPTLAPALSSTGSAGCRLLWRGRLLLTQDGNKPLFGIAIIAHLFSVPSILSSSAIKHASTSSVSPFDDPFASSSLGGGAGAGGGGADMCLGLEMMRGGDLRVLGEVSVTQGGKELGAEGASGGRKTNGKGKGKEELEQVQVETPTDVKVYVDPRCPETRDWFEDRFCRAGCEGRGLRVDMGGEEIIIFASLPPVPSSSSADTPPQRTPITLLLGRAIKRPVRVPRPDDPMPRESLFATKLRRTSSTPTLSFPPSLPKLARAASSSLSSISESLPSSTSTATAHTQAQRKLKRGGSSRTLMSLMGDEAARKSAPPPPGPASAPAGRKRTLSRSFSSSRSVLPTDALPRPPLPTATSAPPLGAPVSLGVGRARSSLKRSRSMRVLDSPPSSDAEGEEGGEQERRRGASRVEGSPTPSVATTFGGWEGDEDLPGGEEDDELKDLAAGLGQPFLGGGGIGSGSGVGGGGGAGKRGGMKRSTSAPVGVFEKQLGAGPLRDGLGGRREGSVGVSATATGGRASRAGSVDPRYARGESVGIGVAGSRRAREDSVFSMREREGSLAPAGGGRGREESAAPETVEGRNKGTIRKLVLTSLLSHQIPREHAQFRDVFSMCSKGVQFALREHWKTAIVDKERATELVERHVGMYVLPSPPSTATSTSTSAPTAMEVDPPPRQQEQRMPTPAATPVPPSHPAPDPPTQAEVGREREVEIKTEDPFPPPPPSIVLLDKMQLDAPPLIQRMKEKETHLPSPRSLEVNAEEDSAEERGIVVARGGEEEGMQGVEGA